MKTDVLLQRLQRPSAVTIFNILTLWREGYDTFVIAARLSTSEADIANRLAHIRDIAVARHG